MLKNANPHCQPVLQFNRDRVSKIDELCSPLKEHFGVSAFHYLRIFDDGRYNVISNKDFMLKITAVHDAIYSSEHFSQLPDRFCKYDPNVSVFPDQTNDWSIELCRSEGFFSGITIARELNGSMEAACFLSEQNGASINDFFQKHYEVLLNFVDHFRHYGGDLTRATGQDSLGFSPYLQKTYPKIEKIFKASTPWERQIMEFNTSLDLIVKNELAETCKKYTLSLRELECLSHLTTGKTAKEIAREMGLSPRTVDSHIMNLRNKTGCFTKRELTDWFLDKFKPFLGKSPLPRIEL